MIWRIVIPCSEPKASMARWPYRLWPVLIVVALAAASAAEIQAKVVGIADGDTITVLHEGKQIRVRLHGIDAPESGQAFGARAKQFTSSLAEDLGLAWEQVTRRLNAMITTSISDVLWWDEEAVHLRPFEEIPEEVRPGGFRQFCQDLATLISPRAPR
jgi:hypothetical protein